MFVTVGCVLRVVEIDFYDYLCICRNTLTQALFAYAKKLFLRSKRVHLAEAGAGVPCVDTETDELERFLTVLNHKGVPVAAVSDSGFMPVQEAGMDGASIVGKSSR